MKNKCQCGAGIRTARKLCSRCAIQAIAAEKRNRKKQFNDALESRCCKVCGQQMNSRDPRKITCSNECGYENRRKEKATVPCLVCGISVTRYKHRIEQFGGACCSHQCQKAWAGAKSWDSRERNWHNRSQRAKAKWKRLRSIERYAANPWRAQIAKRLANLNRREYSDDWDYAIRTRLGSAKGRKVKRRMVVLGSASVQEALKKTSNRLRWFHLDDWTKKIRNKLSNLAHRRRRKDVIKGTANQR